MKAWKLLLTFLSFIGKELKAEKENFKEPCTSENINRIQNSDHLLVRNRSNTGTRNIDEEEILTKELSGVKAMFYISNWVAVPRYKQAKIQCVPHFDLCILLYANHTSI